MTTEPSTHKARKRISQTEFNPLRQAVVAASLGEPLELLPDEGKELVSFDRYQGDRMEITVHARSRGLLVLSEVYYPGWRATVNGRSAPIHKVNGLLRGIVVSAGESRVAMRYAPRSVLAGAVLSLSALLATLALAVILCVNRKRTRSGVPLVGNEGSL